MKVKILELRKNGCTVNEIANQLNCAKSTVSYHINKNDMGGNINSFLYGIDDSIIDKIKTLRLELKTYAEIKTIINISEDKIKKICKKLKLNKPINVQRISLDKKSVLDYYKSVKSLRLTAKYFNVSRDLIRKHIDDNEIISRVKINKKSNSKAVIDWRKRKKKELVEYKGGECIKCGYNKSIKALEFHHIDPNKKDFTISGKSYSIKRLKIEVDKCILVCSNCHNEIHEKLENLKNKH